MSVQRDKTLPAATLIVPSSALASFLTFSIARIDSGMPGRELGGKARCLRLKKKGFVWAPCHQEFWEGRVHEGKFDEWCDVDVLGGIYWMLCLLWHICLSLDQRPVKNDAFRRYVSRSFSTAVLVALGRGTSGPLSPCVWSLCCRLSCAIVAHPQWSVYKISVNTCSAVKMLYT